MPFNADPKQRALDWARVTPGYTPDPSLFSDNDPVFAQQMKDAMAEANATEQSRVAAVDAQKAADVKWGNEQAAQAAEINARGGGILGDVVGAIGNAVNAVGDAVTQQINSAVDTAKAIAANPLPVIETVGLIFLGVPPPVASATVTALNGGTVSDIAAAAIGSYVGGEVTSGLTPTDEVSAYPTSGIVGDVPAEATNSVLVKAATSAVGADAGATTAALIKGNNLEDSLAAGTKAAVTSLATTAGVAVGNEVASNIDDPTLSKLANEATSAGTRAALTGGNIGNEIAKATGEDALNALGIQAPKIENLGGSGIDLSSIKDAATQVLQPLEQPIKNIAQAGADAATSVLQPLEQPIKNVVQAGADTATRVLQPLEQPIKDVAQAGADTATKVLQPVGNAIQDVAQTASDAATKVLQPLEQPIKNTYQAASDAVQSASDAATNVLQPLEQPVKDVAQFASDAATNLLQPLEQPVKDALSFGADVSKNALTDASSAATSDKFDKSVIDLIAQAPGAKKPPISDVASGSSGSPSAYGGADIAMLGDSSQGGLGSKISKKGGKYPWGEPEGTTALKEGLGV